MSDLISREKTIGTMWNLFNSYGNNASVFDVEETEAINMFCSRLQSEIENQPTAYDVEQVVKELEIEIAENPEASLGNYRAGLYKAIEIVKVVE